MSEPANELVAAKCTDDAFIISRYVKFADSKGVYVFFG